LCERRGFARAYVETGNASEAYRRAYNASSMKDETIWRKAKECLDNGKVTARIEALRAEHAQRHNITVDSLTCELEEAREGAMGTGQFSAAVTAIMGNAKLHVLLVDKVRDVTDDTDRLTDAELEAIARGGIEEWAKLRGAEEHGNAPVAPNGSKKPH
jgi:phage terminase small subunit